MKKKICVLVLTFISIVSLFYANTIKVEADTVESMSYGDMIIRTARANGDTSTYLSLADTTVMYGNIENNFIEKFTSFYAPESWSASLGNNGDNAFAENWRIQSKNNIGVILEICFPKDAALPGVQHQKAALFQLDRYRLSHEAIADP